MMFQVASVHMHINRFIRTLPVSPRFLLLMVLLVTNGTIVFVVAPQHWMVILVELVLLSSLIYTLSLWFLTFRNALILGGGVGAFLLLNWLVGFSLLNTILLISAIIAVCGFISTR